MLMRLCKCGRRVPQGKDCPCQKARHNLYDKTCRDIGKKKFYGSMTWKKIVELVKARANGLDEYELANGIISIGNTVHHIFTVDERPDLKNNLDNLIFVSSKTHNKIHAEYTKGEREKGELQKKLVAIVRGEAPKVSEPTFATAPPFLFSKNAKNAEEKNLMEGSDKIGW